MAAGRGQPCEPVCAQGDYPLRSTVVGIESRMESTRFLRVHRGHFINLDYLAGIEPLDSGDARMHQCDDSSIPWPSRGVA